MVTFHMKLIDIFRNINAAVEHDRILFVDLYFFNEHEARPSYSSVSLHFKEYEKQKGSNRGPDTILLDSDGW